VGVRAVAGEKTAFAYSDTLSPDALLSSAHAVRSIARQGAGKARVSAGQRARAQSLYPPVDPLLTMSAPDKVGLLERVEKMARAKDPHVKQVMASLGMEYDVVMIAGSDGRLSADVRPLVRLSLSVVVERNGRRETGNAGGGGRSGLEYFSDEILRQYVDSAVHEAMVNLDARPAPAGEMTVVLAAGWPGILLHEAVGHGLEGDFNRKGSSVFSGKVGQRVASKGVTVVDDGTIQGRRGSLNVDDEGNATQRNVLIEDGILRGYLQDTLNARLMKTGVTGNGRRESFAHLPMPRMTNTFMLSGREEPEEMISSVKKGIYAANFGGGQVDITSGKFVFSASEAYMIENGRITYPIKGATLIGSGPESMNSVSMIGNNMKLDCGVGTCGKEGQSVPVGVGMPTIKMEGLTVGGTA
jgi:TldD protein